MGRGADLAGSAQCLGILVTSREGMGAGAPQSQKLLDQLLKALLERMPKAQVSFRSDRDGPIRQVP
jgi:hypothetical protein